MEFIGPAFWSKTGDSRVILEAVEEIMGRGGRGWSIYMATICGHFFEAGGSLSAEVGWKAYVEGLMVVTASKLAPSMRDVEMRHYCLD